MGTRTITTGVFDQIRLLLLLNLVSDVIKMSMFEFQSFWGSFYLLQLGVNEVKANIKHKN